VHRPISQLPVFAEKTILQDLVLLGQRVNLPLIEDLGSGCLVDLFRCWDCGADGSASVDAGVSIVMFSGDKLLEGHSGIIAGNKGIGWSRATTPSIPRPSCRQTNYRGTGGDLGAYLRGAVDEIPALRMIRMSVQEIKRAPRIFFES